MSDIKVILIDHKGNYINPKKLSWLKRILLRLKYFKGDSHGRITNAYEHGFRKWDKLIMSSIEMHEIDVNKTHTIY